MDFHIKKRRQLTVWTHFSPYGIIISVFLRKQIIKEEPARDKLGQALPYLYIQNFTIYSSITGWIKSTKQRAANAVPYLFSMVIPSVIKFNSPK